MNRGLRHSGIAAGRVVDDPVAFFQGGAVLISNRRSYSMQVKPVTHWLFTRGAALRRVRVFDVMRVHVAGDQGGSGGPASVRHQKNMVPDMLHIQHGGGEVVAREIRLTPGFGDEDGFPWIENGAKLPADGGEIIPVIRLVVPAAEIASAHVHIGKLQIVFPGDLRRHAGQRRIDVYRAGLGGGVQMQAGQTDVGKGVQRPDDSGESAVFIAVAKAAASLRNQHLRRAERGEIAS